MRGDGESGWTLMGQGLFCVLEACINIVQSPLQLTSRKRCRAEDTDRPRATERRIISKYHPLQSNGTLIISIYAHIHISMYVLYTASSSVVTEDNSAHTSDTLCVVFCTFLVNINTDPVIRGLFLSK